MVLAEIGYEIIPQLICVRIHLARWWTIHTDLFHIHGNNEGVSQCHDHPHEEASHVQKVAHHVHLAEEIRTQHSKHTRLDVLRRVKGAPQAIIHNTIIVERARR